MNRGKKVQKTTVTNEYGEILSETNVYINKIATRPFCVLFLDCDIKLGGVDWVVLYSLIKEMDYDNKINIASSDKKHICLRLGISTAQMDNSLSVLVSNGLIKRMDRGMFMLNPNIAGKGKLKEIIELTKEYENIKSIKRGNNK